MPRLKKEVYPLLLQNRYGQVKIYQGGVPGNRLSYTLAWKTGRGRNREKLSDPQAAKVRAEEILKDFELGAESRKGATASRWAYYQQCEQKLNGVPLEDAIKFYLDHHSKPKTESPMFKDLVTRFMQAQKTRGASDRSYETWEQHLNRAAEALVCPVESISPSTLNSYLESIKNLRTRHNHRGTLVHLFSWAKDMGYLPDDRRTAAERTLAPNYKLTDPEIITPDQLEKVLRAAEKDAKKLVPFIALGAFAGIRNAEICRIMWSDIRFDQNIINLSSSITKTSQRRTALINDTLKAWLSVYAKTAGPVVELEDPNYARRTLTQRIGVKWPHNCLRHSYISYSVMLSRNASEVAEQCGHSLRMLQTHYKNLTDPETATKWFAILPQQNAQ